MRRALGRLRHTPPSRFVLIAMTCEKPSESERPISHWSQREIADEAIRRGLVSNISQRSVSVTTSLKILGAVIPRRVFTQPGPNPDSRPPSALRS
jgi:hypothetical protein